MSNFDWKQYRGKIGMALIGIGAGILAVLAFNAGSTMLPGLGVLLILGGGVLFNRYGDE